MYDAGGFEQNQHVVLSASSFCTSVVLWFKLSGNFPKTLWVTTVKGAKFHSSWYLINVCVPMCASAHVHVSLKSSIGCSV